jgi:hypothetical protein
MREFVGRIAASKGDAFFFLVRQQATADDNSAAASFAMQAFLDGIDAYTSYIMRVHVETFLHFPLRIATWWDPVEGHDLLCEDVHTYQLCKPDKCQRCQDGVPQKSRDDFVKDGAYAFGVLAHPAYLAAIQAAVQRPRILIQPQAISADFVRSSSLHPVLDVVIYDRIFSIISCHSMETERSIQKLGSKLWTPNVSNVKPRTAEAALWTNPTYPELKQEDMARLGKVHI